MKTKVIVAILVIAVALASVAAIKGFEAPVRHLALPDYLAEYHPGHPERVDVAGTVGEVAGSYPVEFTLQDGATGDRLPVVTQADISSENFGAGRDVRVIGRRRADGVFEADQVLVKCSHAGYQDAKAEYGAGDQ